MILVIGLLGVGIILLFVLIPFLQASWDRLCDQENERYED